jgi:hypothetical protein
MESLLEVLRRRGWTVLVTPSRAPLLPPPVTARYPNLPPEVTEFLSQLEVCTSADETVWFLTRADYSRTDGPGFRWNEYELMGMDAAATDPGMAEEVQRFWDRHFPFVFAVHSDYDYLALRLDDGAVVHGYAPEWESPTLVSASFRVFIREFEAAAASPKPEWPLSVFMGAGG